MLVGLNIIRGANSGKNALLYRNFLANLGGCDMDSRNRMAAVVVILPSKMKQNRPYWAYHWLMASLVRTEVLFGYAAALVVVLV